MPTFKRGFKAWCEKAASEIRSDLELDPADPLDPRLLADHLSVALWTPRDVDGLEESYLKVLLEDDADSWSAVTVSINSTYVIIWNPTHSIARQASDLYHELAHILLGHKGARVDIGPDGHLLLNTFDRNQEDEANWLAGCLLLPRPALIRIRSDQISQAQVRHKYFASAQMLKFRMQMTGVDLQFRRSRQRRG